MLFVTQQHCSGKHLSEETKRKISKANKEHAIVRQLAQEKRGTQ
jgi:hypothetical protein